MAVENKAGKATLWIILLFVGFLSLVPFSWIIAGSFKPHVQIHEGHLAPWHTYKETVHAEAPDGEPTVVERRFTLDNYGQILGKLGGLPTYYFNTIYLAVAGTFLALFVGSLAAYGFARFRFPGNTVLFVLLLLTIMIPAEVTLMGRFELIFGLRLLNTLVGLLLCYVAGSLLLVIFIMRNVFMSIDQDILDAAMIDGASTWQVFWEIMVPIGRNGLAACGILTFLAVWNEFLFALTFNSVDGVRTLPVGIVLLKGQFGLFDTGVLFATVLLSFLPIIVVFILLQKYFVAGLSTGALKQ
jgi:multiple sugar transport system permease protein